MEYNNETSFTKGVKPPQVSKMLPELLELLRSWHYCCTEVSELLKGYQNTPVVKLTQNCQNYPKVVKDFLLTIK